MIIDPLMSDRLRALLQLVAAARAVWKVWFG